MGAADNWSFGYSGEEHGVPYTDIGQGVRLYDVRSRFSDAFGESRTEKIGYAIHHDAAAMKDEDRNFNGTTIDEELARLGVIHRTHVVDNGWGGIGYHRVIAPSGRVYITGSSGTQRAHVAGLNHLYIGYCFMGDWSNERPSEKAMYALRVALQWETDRRQVEMMMAPHKRLNPDTTACPGGWTTKDSWLGLVLQPAAVEQEPPVHEPAATEYQPVESPEDRYVRLAREQWEREQSAPPEPEPELDTEEIGRAFDVVEECMADLSANLAALKDLLGVK